MATLANHKPVAASPDEQLALDELDAQLSACGTMAPKLTTSQGQEVMLPESVVHLLRQLTHELAQHRAVILVPLDRELTTQQAADLLNMSRPTLIGLLEQGTIPYTTVGSHRRVQFDEVMRYKAQRDASRKQALDELARLNQEMGLYDR